MIEIAQPLGTVARRMAPTLAPSPRAPHLVGPGRRHLQRHGKPKNNQLGPPNARRQVGASPCHGAARPRSTRARRRGQRQSL